MSSLYRAFVAILILTSFVSAQDSIPLVCHDNGVQVIALAGTNVPNGTYGLGASFANNIVGRIQGSDDISLNYNRFHTSTGGGIFVKEVNQGVGALRAALLNYTTACPNTPIVIHGYSEGGCVVMNTICGGAYPWTSPAALPASYANNSMGIVIFQHD